MCIAAITYLNACFFNSMLREAWRNGVGGGRKENLGKEELVGTFARCSWVRASPGELFFFFFLNLS